MAQGQEGAAENFVPICGLTWYWLKNFSARSPRRGGVHADRTSVFVNIAAEIISEKNDFESASMIAPDDEIEVTLQDHRTLCV